MIKEKLVELGLTENEAKLYEFLLEHYKAKASELAKYLGVSHTAVKKMLDSLLEKKLIRSQEYSKTRFYFPEKSQQIVKFVQTQNERLEKELSKRMKTAQEMEEFIENKVTLGRSDETEIKYFKGREGISEFVHEVAHSDNKTVNEFIDMDLILYPKAKDGEKILKEYQKNNIKFDAIYTSDEKEYQSVLEFDALKLEKQSVITPTAHMFIYDDKVAFSYITDDRTILVIKNPWIRNTIYTLFNNLKENKKPSQ